MTTAIFAIIWTSLVFLPPAAYLCARHVRERRPAAVYRTMLGSALIVVQIFVFLHFGFALTNAFANLLLVAVDYFAWCYLVAFSGKIRRRVFRIPLFLIGIFPIACGYLAGTIGIGFLFFVTGDFAQPPDSIVTIRNSSVTCEHSHWGFAGNSGYNLILYDHWIFAPFVKREIAREVAYDYSEDAAMSCSEMWRKYESQDSTPGGQAAR